MAEHFGGDNDEEEYLDGIYFLEEEPKPEVFAFEAGKTYTVKVTMLMDVTPEQSCNFIKEEIVKSLMNNEIQDLDSCIINVETSLNMEAEKQKVANTAVETWAKLFMGSKPTELSIAQIEFITDCLDCGLEVRQYSGRGMFGKICPGVRVKHPNDLPTGVSYQIDNLGLEWMLYVP
jgi:hypothetical protein